MPSADFVSAVRVPLDSLSPLTDTEQSSWGKLSRLLCTAAGSTLRTLDGYGLRGKLPARPALAPNIRFLSIDLQISWGKLSRLLCTAAGSTLRTLDGYGLRGKLPARPALAPNIRFLSIDSHICYTLLSDPASRR